MQWYYFDYEYKGCYKDHSPIRDLPMYYGTSLSLSQCNALTRNSKNISEDKDRSMLGW